MSAQPITQYTVTSHAAFEIERRGIGEEILDQVMTAPEQHLTIRPGRDLLQSKIFMDSPEREFLVRVIVDVAKRPAEVVTVYRTSKISKYWRENP